jgi:hypothetical protein
MKPRIKSTSKAITQSSRRCKRTLKTMAGLLIASALGVVAVFTQSSRFLSGSAAAQGEGISQGALRQIEALIEEAFADEDRFSPSLQSQAEARRTNGARH